MADMTTEQELIAVAIVIGGIADTPHWVTAGLAAAIEATDKSVHELTVGQLVELADAQRARINDILGSGHA